MLYKIVGFCALLCVCAAQSKVPVYVYYESLCPDSQAFITQQLYPAMQGNLKMFVDLKLVPYGKSNDSTLGSDVRFTCHHGEVECYGNKVQSCAIEHIQVNSFQSTHTRESLTLAFINCLMKAGKTFPDSIYPGERCATETGITANNWQGIEQCANTTDGSKLLQKNGELTRALQPTLASVPTITFRQQYEAAAQKLAVADFRAALCSKISAPLPIECRMVPNGGQSTAAATLSLITIAFVLARFF